MKKKIFKIFTSALCAVLCFTGVACGGSHENGGEEQLAVVEGEYLYKNGISEYSILIRDDANYYESFAADELTLNLQRATGNGLAIVTESEIKDTSHVISLGHTSLWDEKVGLTLSEKEILVSGYYIQTVGNNIYISCPDNTSSSGVLYGVYDFLEDLVDYTFYAADEVYCKQTKEIPLYAYAGKSVNPTFEMRMLTKADLRDDTTSVMRYRMTYPSGAFGLVAWGHGQVSQYVLPDAACTCGLEGCEGKTHQQHHPDWYSSYGTKDIQLCWTGGETLERVTANRFIQFFQQYPDAEYFMFGQEDSISYCDCERCQKAMQDYAGNPAGLQVAFMNNVIKLTEAWLDENQPGRNIKYIIYAYYGTENAPVKKTADGKVVPYSDKVDPVDELYIFYTPIGANFAYQIDDSKNIDTYNNLSEWSAIADGQLIMYLYDINFRNYLINFNNFGTVKGMYETCYELGVACMTSQAADSYTTCFQEMRSYVESSLMWDLSQSYDDLAKDFMNAYYKDAGAYLYEFYEITRDRYNYYQNIISSESGSIYGDVNTSVLWTQPVIEKIDELFDKALASIEKYKTSDPALYDLLKTRIMKECLSPIYIKLTVIPQYYSEEEIAELRATFKYYANLFKLSESHEGADFGDLLD
jgi:hypothetical protein